MVLGDVALLTLRARPLSAGSITVSLSFLGCFSACCSSLVKLCSGIEADCIVETIPCIKGTSAETARI